MHIEANVCGCSHTEKWVWEGLCAKLIGAVCKAWRGRVQTSPKSVCKSRRLPPLKFMTVTSEQYIYITRTKVRELYCFGSCTEMAYCICFRQTIEHRSGKGMVVFYTISCQVLHLSYYTGKKYFKRTENKMKVAFCVSYNLQRCSYSFIEFPKLLHLVMALDKATRNMMIRNLSIN